MQGDCSPCFALADGQLHSGLPSFDSVQKYMIKVAVIAAFAAPGGREKAA